MSNFDPLSDQPDFDGASGEGGESDVPPEDQIIETPKRSRISQSTLLMLGLLAVVGGGTYLMIISAGAQITGPGATASAADSTISGFLSGGVQSFRQKIAKLADTERTIKQFNASPASHQVPVDQLHGNPFGVAPVKEVAAGPLSDDAARREAEEARKAAADKAATLKLQSILFGPRSSCMINGKLYIAGKGDGMFVVEKIDAQSVVIRISGQDFQLTMTPAESKD